MKKKLLTISSVLLLLLMLAFSASAVGFKEFKTKSTYTPVTYSTHKSTDTVTLYGNADYLCMKAYSETQNYEYFRIDVYSDSKRTKQIRSYSNTFKKGTTYADVFFDLTSLKSKTYYATSYVMKESQAVLIGDKSKKDPATVKNFKIVVKRDGTSIKNMKSVMYGYENTFYGPAVYWYSVPGATKYYVYRYQDKQYKKIATVKANGENFSYYIDKSLKDKNVTRYYKVKAVNGTGSTAMSLNKAKVITLKTPKVTATLHVNGGIKVTWTKAKNSCIYVVYRSTEDSTEWKELVTTSSRTYYDQSVKSGVTYYYTVMAYNNTTVSGYNPYGTKCLCVKMPSIKSVTQADGNLVVSWSAVRGAESYNVYRKAPGETNWSMVANVTETSYTDTDCERNKIYKYTVRTVIGKTLSLYYKAGVSGAVIDTPVLNEIERTEDGYAKISWGAIDGVSYKVYRKEGDSSWTHLGTTTSTEYIDTSNLVNGKKYIYTVKSHIGSINGGYDKTGKQFEYLVPAKNFSFRVITDGIQLFWDKVEGAQEYILYRKSGEEDFVRIATCTTDSYIDKTILESETYEYKLTYVLGSAEQSELAAYKHCSFSEQLLSLTDEEAAKYYPGYDAGWQVRIKDYDPQAEYTVYRKTETGWVLNPSKAEKNYLLIYTDNTSEATYIITSVSAEGIVKMSSQEGFTFERLPAPKTLTANVDHKNGTISITWSAVEGADKYYVYRKSKLVGIYDDVDTHIQTGIKPGSYNDFQVLAVKGYSMGLPISKQIYLLYIPKIETVSFVTDGVSLRWKGNFACNVYRRAEDETEWRRIKSNAKGGYIDSDLISGMTYYYTIACVDSLGQEGRYDEYGVKVKFIASPTIKSVTHYASSIKITWKKVPIAEYYKVYRDSSSSSSSNKSVLVYTTKDANTLKFTDKNVKSGYNYIYKVKAVVGDLEGAPAFTSESFVAPPKNLTAKKVDDGIKLTFGKVNGATSLYIYRKNGSGDWKKIGSAKGKATSYTDKTAKTGVKYTYHIKSYDSTHRQLSAKSANVSCKR